MTGVPGNGAAVDRGFHRGTGQGNAEVFCGLELSTHADHLKCCEGVGLGKERRTFGKCQSIRGATAGHSIFQPAGSACVLNGAAGANSQNLERSGHFSTSALAPPIGSARRLVISSAVAGVNATSSPGRSTKGSALCG